MAQKEIVAKKIIIIINSSKIHCKNLRYIILRNLQQQVYSCTCFYIVAGFVVNVGYIKYFAAWPNLETKKKPPNDIENKSFFQKAKLTTF